MCTKLTREGIVYIWFDLIWLIDWLIDWLVFVLMKDGLNNWDYYVNGCLYNVDNN